MKIVFRVTNLTNGGAEKVVLSLAQQFKKNHDVVIVVDNNDGENFFVAKEYGIIIHNLAVERTLSSIVPFAKFIKKFKPDIIYSALTDPNAAAVISNFIAGNRAKLIVSEHAPVVKHWKGKSILRKVQLWCYVIFLYRLCSAVVCVSKGLAIELKKYSFLSNVHTLYNPIRTLAASNINVRNEKFTILTVGRITKAKDLECLLRTASLLKDLNIQFRWNIVGSVEDKDYFDKVLKLVTLYDLKDVIEFHPFTNQLEKFYENADLFVLTSAWEGFGNVIVEALQFGLTVVATDCDYGPREILENGLYGHLVPVGDHTKLAELIYKCVIGDGILSRDLLINRSKYFAEESVFNQYSLFFKKIAHK